MNDQQRADLDAWFAEADDVLDNWRPGLDAMVAPASLEPNSDPLPRGDSYYDQPRATSPLSMLVGNTVTVYFGIALPPPSAPRLDVQ